MSVNVLVSYLEKLVDVESHIIVLEFRIQCPKISVVNVFKDE